MEYNDWSTDESESVNESSEEIMPYVRRLTLSGQCSTVDALIGMAKDMFDCNNRHNHLGKMSPRAVREQDEEDDVEENVQTTSTGPSTSTITSVAPQTTRDEEDFKSDSDGEFSSDDVGVEEDVKARVNEIFVKLRRLTQTGECTSLGGFFIKAKDMMKENADKDENSGNDLYISKTSCSPKALLPVATFPIMFCRN